MTIAESFPMMNYDYPNLVSFCKNLKKEESHYLLTKALNFSSIPDLNGQKQLHRIHLSSELSSIFPLIYLICEVTSTRFDTGDWRHYKLNINKCIARDCCLSKNHFKILTKNRKTFLSFVLAPGHVFVRIVF
jgi:hypothetical protein